MDVVRRRETLAENPRQEQRTDVQPGQHPRHLGGLLPGLGRRRHEQRRPRQSAGPAGTSFQRAPPRSDAVRAQNFLLTTLFSGPAHKRGLFHFLPHLLSYFFASHKIDFKDRN